MRILLTGASGFVGRPLARRLFLAGHELVILSRDPDRAEREIGVGAGYHRWDPLAGPPPAAALEGVEAVVNMMGENLGAGRWTAARKRAIHDSRVVGTRNLAAGLRDAAGPAPAVLVNFSAIGYYPVNEAAAIDETGPAGDGFAAEVCRDWETAAQEVPAGRRVVLRVGTVLGANGGALEKLLPPFRSGGGGPVGAGRQMMSWIHREDLVALCCRALEEPDWEGPYNAVAPEPVSNREFSRTLGRVLGKPALVPLPPPVLKLAFGEMAQLLLDSQAIVSRRLAEHDFEYRFGGLREALEEACGLLPVALDGSTLQCDRYEDFVFIRRPREDVFAFFGDPHNLERITPPLLRFRVEAVSTDAIGEGTVIDYRLRLRGIPMHWKTLIREWSPAETFVDFQLEGPYRVWNHRHSFRSVAGGTAMIDRVDYRLPLGAAGALLGGPLVRGDVRRIFDFRRRTILELLEAQG